ncbi:MAG: hypothetical protein ACXABD_01570 [Candidatus Thorarchaeota archaeon]|jgi:ubiquitin fusion degradation protein 1
MTSHSWTLSCLNPVFNPNAKNLQGDSIIVPQKILEDIQHLDKPFYQFVVKNSGERQTLCCRVEEFCANDDMYIYMPSWMMHNLYLNDMDDVKLCLMETELDSAKKIVVQPHDSIFLTLSDHKNILESSLKLFSSLTTGTSISISHNNSDYSLSVVKVDPNHQYVSLIDTDVEVEFMPPLDYVEVKPDDWPTSEQWPLDPGVYIKEEVCSDPKEYVLSNGKRITIKPPTPPLPSISSPPPTPSPPPQQQTKFVPFSGKGNRLGS